MNQDKYLETIINKHLRNVGHTPHYVSGGHTIPDDLKEEIDKILSRSPHIITSNITSYDKIKKEKAQQKTFKAEKYAIDSDWWDEKHEEFDPFYTRTLKMRRNLPAMQRLASSENKSIQVTMSNGGRCGVNLADGIAFFDFPRGTSNALKKIIILHEAAHLSITPHLTELNIDDQEFVKKNQQLINIIEDIRVNRYLCLKYPGLPRYFVEECDNNYTPFMLSIGDLCGLNDEDIEYPAAMIAEIRACRSFDDVLVLARKLVNEVDSKENPSDDEVQHESTEGYQSDAGENGEEGDETEIYGELCEDLNRSFSTQDTRQLFDMYDNTQTFDRRLDQLKVVEKPESYFLGREHSIRGFKVPKSLEMFIKQQISGRRRTREGKLAKFDPIRLTTDKKIFQRKNREVKNPDAIMAIDMSGSMYYNDDEMRSLTHEMLKLFKEMDMKVKIYAHSGETGEFHVAEIKPENIPSLEPQNYTLDGSMLEYLYKEVGHLKKKPIVFYFSDGQMAVQYRNIQRPKITQYISMFEQKGIPIFGIGLNSRSVKEFKHYYCIYNQKDLTSALKKIAKVITRYRVIR